VFIGHYAVAMGAKRLAPKTSLGTLVAAAVFIDLLWPLLLLLGLERVRIAPGITAFTPLDFESYPISHSLLTCIGWAGAFGLVYWAAKRYPRGALITGALVLSHWGLDFVAHRPDLPLTPYGAARFGLGLWNSVAGTLIVEGTLFAAMLWIYSQATRARDAIGRWALIGFVAFLLLIYMSAAFGPLPPSVDAIAWSGHAQWLFVALAAWLDRHRTAIV